MTAANDISYLTPPCHNFSVDGRIVDGKRQRVTTKEIRPRYWNLPFSISKSKLSSRSPSYGLRMKALSQTWQ